MSDPRIQLRDPWTAAILAFLIPGAGHLYQRRFFKAAIYSVCILGTFTYGMALGDWRAVYMHTPAEYPGQKPELVWGYVAQVGVGLPALPAVLQSRRYHSPENLQAEKLESAVADHRCVALFVDPHAIEFEELDGTLNLDTEGNGSFSGTNADQEAIELKLAGFAMRDGRPSLDPPVSAEPDRMIECMVVDADNGLVTGRLRCAIPRPFKNWFEVPPTEASLGELHRMGKIFDLAQVFTWIAGLLNILAIWDAFDGPAYGYGDDPAGSERETTDANQSATGPTEPVNETATAASTGSSDKQAPAVT